jgi:lysophospholipase L1-like esterase
MNSPVVPSHAWRACLLAAATAGASSADQQVAYSHVARSWAGTWDAAPFNDQPRQALRLQAAVDLLAQQTDRLVSPSGSAALARVERDLLVTAGTRHVIVLLGIGDMPASSADPAPGIAALIALYRQLIARAHARGLVIHGGTMMPFERVLTPVTELVRQGANDWMRSSGEFDAVIDFDQALRDPLQPGRLLPAYDSGDHLHPNDAGVQAMANAIPLTLFAGADTMRARRAKPPPARAAARATSGCAPLPPPGAG